MEELKGLNVLAKITRDAITESDANIIFKQIVSVINQCHNKNIIFRDIRLENFYCIDKKGFNIKLLD